MSFRRRGSPMPPMIACKNHPGVAAQDKHARLCKNCLAMSAQGKSLQERAAGKPAEPTPPLHKSARR
jgi:hypothetical protein